jgi:hypothetical protein
MGITYKKLYKMLIDRDMTKKELAGGCRLSVATVAKLGKCRNVNTDVDFPEARYPVTTITHGLMPVFKVLLVSAFIPCFLPALAPPGGSPPI